MPKDKKDFGITMKEACENTKKLGQEFERINKMKEEDKAERLHLCCYCMEPMGDECHYVIKNGKMVMAHKRCHKRDQDGEKKTPNVMIR